MAYVSKEKKAKIKAALDEALKGTGVKYTLGVQNHSTIVCNVRKGPIDFIGNYLNATHPLPGYDVIARNYIDVNPYHYKDHFTGEVLEIISKMIRALNTDNYDNSDSMSDYFDVGHYVDLNIGKWNKPYELVG